MSDFFKQLITQLSAVWQKLSLQQKIITSALVGFTLFGLVGLLIWSHSTGSTESGYRVLYSNLDIEDASLITEQLDNHNFRYRMQNNGSTVTVQASQLYEARMALAREGLPRKRGLGYELFDGNNFGMTDYVQKLNHRRALEGEIQRTIEGLSEVRSARVHIVIPENTIFLDQQQDSKASVVLNLTHGNQLSRDQVRGISYLVSSSVDGLSPENISILDYNGRLLSNPYAQDETAIISSRNMELQQNVEQYLEKKSNQLLLNILGPSKAYVNVSAVLDFDRVEKTIERFDPESRVIRSEELIEEFTKNAPDGDHTRERSLTNYEINRTLEQVVREVGNIERLTVSVAVDGRYQQGENGEQIYVERSPEELQNIEDIVRNAVGYDITRGDQITVSAIQFDNEFLRREQMDMQNREQWEFWMTIAKYVLIFIIALVFMVFLKYVAGILSEAMNPPVPAMENFGITEDIIPEVPEDVRYHSEILERVEMMTREEPDNISSIIKEWLSQPAPKRKK
ncbi:flagellar basal-body MS-ring/collar protein FliF [Chitinispirillales bacterium ANBcel5]|uniref:flagellar basal-body MS-ring/collar protein FliF n=1 Tax=Cellulosispirillum alkaliphilum TaxID=3039283 RepID=UPI002A563396|nr:flagellar basal-body MS-ring/collar protein FliF [Chitinispirillales bacterium ANBcel5]